ncbi:MAG: M23 family metallopeptidase, partial [Bacteroidales bacterium]|nr:M23 family metallopeptidase [Bacteroidales bacterium]
WRAHLRGKYTARDKEYHLNRLGSERDADGVYSGAKGLGGAPSSDLTYATIDNLSEVLSAEDYQYVMSQLNLVFGTDTGYSPISLDEDFFIYKNGGLFGYSDWRNNNIENSEGMHEGLDISGVKLGTPIYAVGTGKVVYVGSHKIYGNRMEVLISSKNKPKITITYSHLDTPLRKVGDTVISGQVIATVGDTGKYTSGPHLHFEIRINDNIVLDPSFLFSSWLNDRVR